MESVFREGIRVSGLNVIAGVYTGSGNISDGGGNMIRRSLLTVLFFLFATHVVAEEPRTYVASRGELLYSTSCIGCHSTQVHWRNKRLATDWTHLLSEVRHWEGFSQLAWTDDDVVEVAKYLNAMHYHYAASD
jgi:mono/diheme cytochrome c family protein